MSQYLEERRKRMLGIVTEQVPEKKKPIAKQSDKRKKQQKEYMKIVKEFLKDKPDCKLKSPVCTGKAQGLDHIQKRAPKNFLDRKNLQPSCNACNLYKEENPTWANENGKSKSKFKS